MTTIGSSLDSILPEDSEQAAVFIEVYMQTRDPMVAWLKAGLSDNRYTATVAVQNFMRRPEVAAAIATLEKLGASRDARVEITRDSILADLQNVYEAAFSSGNHNAAINAKKTQAILMNLINQNITVTHRMTVDDLPDAELERIASQHLRDTSIDHDDEPKGIGGPDR